MCDVKSELKLMPGHNHLSNCNCGWCSGGGGGGGWRGGRSWPRSSSEVSIPSPSPIVGKVTKWGDGGDCCALTICPKCGEQVYFVRHNGGSVWFDSLGPPWPKHFCFSDNARSLRLRSQLTEKELVDRVLFVGVIVKTIVMCHGTNGLVVIEYGQIQRYQSVVSTSANLILLPGELVVVTLDDELPRLHWGDHFPESAVALTQYRLPGTGWRKP